MMENQKLIKAPITKEWHFSAHPEPHMRGFTIQYHCQNCERKHENYVEGPFWEVKGHKDRGIAEKIASKHVKKPDGWKNININGINLLICENCAIFLQNDDENEEGEE